MQCVQTPQKNLVYKMSKCAKFFHLYRKEGAESCGISKNQISLMNNYIQFAEALSQESKINEDVIFQNVQATAVKSILKLDKSSTSLKNAKQHIIESLKARKSPTRKTIEFAAGISPIEKVIRKNKLDASEKNKMLKFILSPEQQQQWTDYATTNGLEDMFSALCKITILLKDL
jgi:beta-glucosidase-like glycosyl hydrolase